MVFRYTGLFPEGVTYAIRHGARVPGGLHLEDIAVLRLEHPADALVLSIVGLLRVSPARMSPPGPQNGRADHMRHNPLKRSALLAVVVGLACLGLAVTGAR